MCFENVKFSTKEPARTEVRAIYYLEMTEVKNNLVLALKL